MIEFKPNTKGLKVLTPNGYKTFSGIAKLPNNKKLLKFVLENGSFVEVTKDHTFQVLNQEKLAHLLSIGDLLQTKIGLSKIKEIKETIIEDFVYELTDVDGGNVYFGNDILSHNCKFLGSSNTLVDSDTIERMVHETPVEFKYSGALQIFEPPQENAFYVLGVDSGKGSQSDYSVTQVLKINSDKDIEQVAIYRSNTIDVHDYAAVVDDISKYYNNAFMMVESNDIGEVVCDVLWNDLECDRLINYDKKGLGIRSTRKTKLAGNLLLKKYIENGWLTIKDSTTIYELSIYEEISPNVFHAAGQNDHDDCVTSLVWAVFYLTSTFYDPENNTGDVKKLDSRFSNEVDNMLMYDNDGFFDPNANKIGDMRFDDNWISQNNFW